MHGLLPQATALHRVTLHGAPRDGLRARHRLEQVLASVDWTPAGLPPQAVLLVKHLAPARREVGARSASPPFARRVALALNDCAARARRPWLHADAAAADAVVFTDEAEMVACLVRDWLRGVAAQRWWWRSVLNDTPAAPWLRRQVLARGEVLVPVAVRLMEGPASSGRAVATLEAWFARLDDVQAQEALASVERAFALASPVLPSAVTTVDRQAPSDPARATSEAQEIVLDRDDQLALQRLVSTVPELRDSTLGPPQRRLFAQVLAVVRSPSWVRTPQFAGALSHVEHTAAQSETIDAEAGPEDIEPSIDTGAAVRDDGRRTAQAGSRSERPTEDHTAVPVAAANESLASPAPPLTALSKGSAPSDTPAAVASPETRRTPVDIAPTHVTPGDVDIEFGGIFYLLNAALALGLYGDFTMPRTRGLALSPWDWLALIGRAWFGAAFARDPVWPLLAALAGRGPAQAPERDFDAPTTWSIEPSWIVPWGPVEALSVHTTRSRLCVRHAAGFLVFDVPRDAALKPLAQARALCAAHPALGGATLTCMRPKARALPQPGAARWARWMLGYLDARLAVTLGAETGDDVPSLVCRHTARITTSASAVDVALQLADLPLPIRIAGLDRDPGWIPAAGRDLRFRFI